MAIAFGLVEEMNPDLIKIYKYMLKDWMIVKYRKHLDSYIISFRVPYTEITCWEVRLDPCQKT